jgi:TolB protein
MKIGAQLLPIAVLLAASGEARTESTAELCTATVVASGQGENHVLFHGVSPDGRTIAVGWDRGSGAAIERGAYLLDLRSGKRTEIAQLNNAASFSPDGRFLVSATYSSDRALRTEIMELDRHTGTARTFASAKSGEWLASYSADGRSILFNSTRSGGSDLYRVRRADNLVEKLSQDPRYEAHGQFFDGDRKIIFHRQVAGDDYDIVVLDVRSGETRALGVTPLEEAYPAISPDRRWIAFSAVAKAGEQPNIYTMRADGTGRRRLTSSPAKDAYATWSPDGRWLYFVRFHDQGSRVYRLPVRGGACARAAR